MTVWLPLMGPNERGLNPKGCYARGWNLPGYQGLGEESDHKGWIGLRLDDFIVVDCDNDEACVAWLDHIHEPGGLHQHTLVRKTPHGWHFIYRRGIEAMGVAAAVPWFIPKVDLKVGIAHQIVYHAPGYMDLNPGVQPAYFQMRWMPTVDARDTPASIEEWDEIPDGMGDNLMISLAGKLREWGAAEATIRSALAAVNPVLMPTDPMPAGSIKRLARSAGKYTTGVAETIECPKCDFSFEVI